MVGIDANEDVRTGKIAKLFKTLTPSLSESILDLHGKEGPETCNKNTKRTPIDGLFVSPGIEPSQGGYTSYGQVVDADHRSLSLDRCAIHFLLGVQSPR